MTSDKNRTNKFGEVFTPHHLAIEMLNALPEEFLKNPNNKIIDNSCGKGVFLNAIKEKLMKYHPKEHILKNMLFGVDIQQDNVDYTISFTECHNVVCADALNFDYWGNIKFNLVVGNPPYNNPKNSKKGNACNPLWTMFVKHAISNLIAKDGYLLFVHPPLYRKVDHPLWSIMKNGQFITINMFSSKKSTDIFGCMTKTDWYLWQNSKPNGTTRICDENETLHDIHVYDKNFIPNHSMEEVYQLFDGQTTIIYDCGYHHYTQKHMSDTKTETHIHPCVYLINKKGTHLYWSSRNDKGHFGIPKVIVSMGTGMAMLDEKGDYGMCEICFGIPISSKQEGEKIMEMFSSNKFINILSACKWKTVQIDYKLFRYMRGI